MNKGLPTSTVTRPWRSTDLASLVQHANNYNVWRWLRDRFPHPYSKQDGRDWLAIATERSPLFDFAIEYKGEAVGGVGISPGTDVERISGEVGYWVAEEHWRKGLASSALREIAEHAFEVLGLHRLFAVPFAHNVASIRVLEKVGYRKEGLLRESAVKEGGLLDQLVYAMTAPEWKHGRDGQQRSSREAKNLRISAPSPRPFSRRGHLKNAP